MSDILLFFKGHWLHLVLVLPAVIGLTVLHELAHCVAVWVQGGTVTAFVWLPSGSQWGHMAYVFPPGMEYSKMAVSLSPYALWISLCLLAGVLALRKDAWPFWCASTIFIWLFIVPLADIANAALPYLIWDADNDLRNAFGPTRPAFSIVAAVLGIAAVVYGFLLNKRLYRDRSVGLPAYGVLAATALVILVVISSVRIF